MDINNNWTCICGHTNTNANDNCKNCGGDREHHIKICINCSEPVDNTYSCGLCEEPLCATCHSLGDGYCILCEDDD